MKLSNNTTGKGGGNPADVIQELLEIHRKSHHFSIKKTQPKVLAMLEAAAKQYPLKVLEESLEVFKKKTKDLGKSPHPNYFLKVAETIHTKGFGKNQKDVYIRDNKNLGKSI